VLRHSGTEAVAIGALPGHPTDIAQLLFHDFLLPFEVTSVLILIAIMGAGCWPAGRSLRRGKVD